ncbi:MAG: tol-pal system protein YbgF [Hyphomicrobiales bacterium]
MFRRCAVAAVLLCSASWAAGPAAAQDIATRIFQMEQRINQLTGQVEELNHQVQVLQQQLGQQGSATPAAPPAIRKQPKAGAEAAPQQGGADSSGIEVIQDAPGQKQAGTQIIGSQSDGAFSTDPAPGQQQLGAGNNAAAQNGDGGFQGQVVVDGSQQQADAGTAVAQPGAVTQQDGVEQVSLQPADSPDSLYKTANEALLRRQFPDAEAGFSTFLNKYPDHSLAGSAQYWLGETYYVQGNVKQAAQNFLEAYKKYPKSRRAPDSLLKLGMSLSKMGQQQQACAAFASVSTEFPRAVDVAKRADAEAKRSGC